MKKLMLYGDIESESYKEIAGNIKEENKKCLRMYTVLCSEYQDWSKNSYLAEVSLNSRFFLSTVNGLIAFQLCFWK